MFKAILLSISFLSLYSCSTHLKRVPATAQNTVIFKLVKSEANGRIHFLEATLKVEGSTSLSSMATLVFQNESVYEVELEESEASGEYVLKKNIPFNFDPNTTSILVQDIDENEYIFNLSD